MEDVRGEEKFPGEFRRSQNWIGPAGGTLKDARFVPPHPEEMIEVMSDLERFMNSRDQLEPLINIALIHYQFATIHPFLDGAGVNSSPKYSLEIDTFAEKEGNIRPGFSWYM